MAAPALSNANALLERFEDGYSPEPQHRQIGGFNEEHKAVIDQNVHLIAVVIFLVSLSTTSPPQTSGDQKAAGEWKTVEDVFGFPGANLPGGVVRFNMPRKDLHVTLAGTEVKPGLALGAWGAF